MNSAYSTSSRPKTKVAPGYDNFLEALRDLGRGTVSEAKTQARQAVTADIPAAFGITPSAGELRPRQSFSVEDLRQAESRGESRARINFNAELESLRQRQNAEIHRQMQQIREDILRLTKSMGSLVKEVEVAATQAPVNPGVYHKNFFQQLHQMLGLLKRQADSSREWLASQNHRTSKKNYYWGQVKTSGTKFLLSSERYMVTSTG